MKIVNHLCFASTRQISKSFFRGLTWLRKAPLWGVGGLLWLFSCNYLDVVPDNIPTIDHAFRSRNEAQRYLFGLLGGMPDVGNYTQDPALAGSDEVWIQEHTFEQQFSPRTLRRLLTGEQGTVTPLVNYWASSQSGWDLRGGQPLWTTIADCNFFLENIHKPFDLPAHERNHWTGEVLFVKAYLHFWLFRQYGPIPLIKENLSVNTGSDDIKRYREPVDEVVDYIVSLLDQSMELLPLNLVNESADLGRPNQKIAAALKAQVLTLAASPLFNCNPDYAGYKDNRGVQLFPQDKSAEKAKWQRAATAIKEAIILAETGRHHLYDANIDLQTAGVLGEETVRAMQVRGAATERWNSEIIWGNSRNNSALQQFCMPETELYANNQYNWSPSLRMVEQFYTKNGLPIEDDAEWEGRDLWELRQATPEYRQYIREGGRTLHLHFDREARFYGAIGFDQGTYFGLGDLNIDNSADASSMFVLGTKYGQLSMFNLLGKGSMTGYLCKKMLHCRSIRTKDLRSIYDYAFPIIRLADLYLLYAEALNEWKDAPDDDVYEYIDYVRLRTGLPKVVDAWRDHAVAGKKNLPATKEGMRKIIRRERMNELAFEGAQYWDIRRWKVAEDYLNRPIRGLQVMESTETEFYKEAVLFVPKFQKKDYFSPIRTESLVNNVNLLQSPLW